MYALTLGLHLVAALIVLGLIAATARAALREYRGQA